MDHDSKKQRSPLQVSLDILRVPLSSLVPDPSNARLHPEKNLQSIVDSLRRFGQAEPLVVQAGTRRIIAGNGRYAAMKSLGYEQCDVVELAVDDITATALGIAMNRTADLAEWDDEVLAKLLIELREGHAMEGTGYDDADLDALLTELGAEVPHADLDDPGEQEPAEKPVSRAGDLWLLGDHRLLVGDSTSPADLDRLLQGEKAALLATDPPYCIDYTGADRPGMDGREGGKDWTHVYREIDIPDLGEFLDKAFAAVLPRVHDDAGLYVWHAHVKQPEIAAAFERHGLLLHQVLVWVKPCATFGHSFYRWRHEPCAFGWKRGKKPERVAGQLETVWEADWDGKKRITSFHPTSKPTRLFEIPMELHTRSGEIVLEPFCGSGSQIIAAEKLRRRCFALDIQPAFVDGTIERWQKATGREAVLDGAGQTFAAVKLEEEGVLGEGLAFSPEEKKAAESSPQSINNFYGPVHGAQIQQGSPSAIQVTAPVALDGVALRGFLDNLRGSLDALNLTAEDRSEVDAEVQTAQVQLDSPRPKASILRECLHSLRAILEKAGGTVAGKVLLEGLDKLV